MSNSLTPIMQLQDIAKNYGTVSALRKISLTAREGDVTCILGGKGAGKSTLMGIITGQIAQDDGRYFVDNRPARFSSPRQALDLGIAAVHQTLALVPLLPVWRNFFLGSERLRRGGPFRQLDSRTMRETTRERLAQLGVALTDVEQSAGTLSGDQRQILAIARAIHFGARMLVLDEPTTALDDQQSDRVLRAIDGLAHDQGIGVILITQNPHHAYRVGDRFVVLARGEVELDVAREDVSLDALTFHTAGGAGLARQAETARMEAAAERRQAALALADRFEERIQGIVDQVAAGSTQLHGAADRMVALTTRTRDESTTAAQSSQQARDAASLAAAATGELSGAIAEISQRVNEAARVAQEAVADAARSGAVIRDLSDAASRTGAIVDVIEGIASQTKLLALNATIEAARAGEVGRGFAVVASEVKTLASQTASATQEVASQIRAMQIATEEAIRIIQGIGGTIGTISDIAVGIAAAVEQQDSASREIARGVSDAAAGADRVSSTVEVVSLTAVDAGQSADQMLDAATAMSAQADRLAAEIARLLDEVRGDAADRETVGWPSTAGDNENEGLFHRCVTDLNVDGLAVGSKS